MSFCQEVIFLEFDDDRVRVVRLPMPYAALRATPKGVASTSERTNFFILVGSLRDPTQHSSLVFGCLSGISIRNSAPSPGMELQLICP